MRLVKMTAMLIAIHLGFGFTQMVVSYFAGEVTDYGAAGWISHTPIGTFVNLEGSAPQQGGQETNPSNLKAIFDMVNNTGDMINGLASFNYGFLTSITADDGLVYMAVLGFRMISVLIWLALAMALAYILFDSNLLTSKLGLALVGLGLGIGGLSGIGAAF